MTRSPEPDPCEARSAETGSKPVITLPELAHRLGQSADWLYRCWEEICRQDGMPRPLTSVTARGKPGSRRQNLKWDRASIELWIQLRNPPEIRAAFGHAPSVAANDTGPARNREADELARRMV